MVYLLCQIDFRKSKHLLVVLVKSKDVQSIFLFGGELRLKKNNNLLVHLYHLKNVPTLSSPENPHGTLGCSKPCGLPSQRMWLQPAAGHHKKDPNLSSTTGVKTKNKIQQQTSPQHLRIPAWLPLFTKVKTLTVCCTACR